MSVPQRNAMIARQEESSAAALAAADRAERIQKYGDLFQARLAVQTQRERARAEANA